MKVAVIGGGVAGVAASFALASSEFGPSARVTVFTRGPGASVMTSGAADLTPWTEGRPHEPFDDGLLAFLSALAFYPLRDGSTVVTGAGIFRPARLADPLLLDFAELPPGRVLVVDVNRRDFDAHAICASLGEVAGPHTFEVLRAPSVYEDRELRLPLAALSAAFSKAHAARLGARLEDALARGFGGAAPVVGALVGPFFGTESAALAPLRSLPMPVGEVTSPPEGPAGARLDRALGELLGRLGVRTETGEVIEVRPLGRGVLLGIQEGPGCAPREESFDGCILATGGLVAGGLVSPRARPARPTSPLVPDGAALVGSLLGFDAAADGGRFLAPHSPVGIDEAPLSAAIRVAGDVRADSPLTVLGAAADGLAAARRLTETRRGTR